MINDIHPISGDILFAFGNINAFLVTCSRKVDLEDFTQISGAKTSQLGSLNVSPPSIEKI